MKARGKTIPPCLFFVLYYVKRLKGIKEMDKSKKTKRIISIVINSVFYVVIALILVVSLGVITSKDRNEITNVFGRGIVPILTDSMDGTQSDSFKKGALLIVNV